MSYEANSLGNRQFYGPFDDEHGIAASTNNYGSQNELIIDFDYANLPTESAVYQDIATIPANSLIISSYLYVRTAAAGGTSYNIGLYETDGTVIDADGIDAGVLTAALTANAWIVNDGALVGATIGTAAGQVRVAATGTFTAGEYTLVIRYITVE